VRRAGGSRRRLRSAVLGLTLAGAAATATQAPRALRYVDLFDVRVVEVEGTRYLEPWAVVRAAGLDGDANLFDDADAWRAGVLTLSLVDDVRVRRSFPGTVRLEVREVRPVALVAGEVLRAVDVRGQVVPLDPAGAALNLPILVGTRLVAGRLEEAEAASALATLVALEVRAPAMARRISQVEVAPAGLRVAFRSGGIEALLPAHPTPEQLTQLRLAYADLAARGELERVRRIDVRFRDQVVVSFLDSSVS
jgi:cell division septal protein FtsQ